MAAARLPNAGTANVTAAVAAAAASRKSKRAPERQQQQELQRPLPRSQPPPSAATLCDSSNRSCRQPKVRARSRSGHHLPLPPCSSAVERSTQSQKPTAAARAAFVLRHYHRSRARPLHTTSQINLPRFRVAYRRSCRGQIYVQTSEDPILTRTGGRGERKVEGCWFVETSGGFMF